MSKLKIGDVVNWRGGFGSHEPMEAVVKSIEITNGGKYGDAVGKDGNLLTGRGASKESATFRSQAELVQAMSDPRYDNDPAYRQDVMRKLENSDLQF